MAHPSLHLLHLSSPALPIGAYAYSQGLEYAIEAAWVDGETLREWLSDALFLGVARLDLPILLRAHAAAAVRDRDRLDTLNDLILAHRESAELLLEDQQIGGALLRLLRTLELDFLPQLTQTPAYAVAFAIACAGWNLDVDAALQGYCYSWLENQVSAATKLIPLGQSRAQQVLLEVLGTIESACAQAHAVTDEEIGGSLPGLAFASAHHERQHTRLFRS